MYTVEERVEYRATIQEWKDGQWVPFASDKVQLEFQMLDPYFRIRLPHIGNGHYFETFLIPDVYGVFTFKLRFRELGYTFLNVDTLKSVRPYRHDEYPRFLFTASPYYASAISMAIGVVFFSIFFLFSK